LTISLGNDAMQHGHDLARALRDVAANVDYPERVRVGDQYETGPYVSDINGNRVGQWAVNR
jgi:hypothetical protein